MVWYFLSPIHKHYNWTRYSHFCFGGLPELYKWNFGVFLCNLMDRLFWEYLHKNLMCRRSAFKDIWKCPHHNVGHWTSNVGPAGFDIQCWFMVRACGGGVVGVFCTWASAYLSCCKILNGGYCVMSLVDLKCGLVFFRHGMCWRFTAVWITADKER
jgi:hypothetical protein